jgi:hypothetical protein
LGASERCKKTKDGGARLLPTFLAFLFKANWLGRSLAPPKLRGYGAQAERRKGEEKGSNNGSNNNISLAARALR